MATKARSKAVDESDESDASSALDVPEAPDAQHASGGDLTHRLLHAAAEVFAEKGYDTANTRDIAAAAGVTHTTIRYHFGSKDGLYRQCAEAIVDRFALSMGESTAPAVEFLAAGGSDAARAHALLDGRPTVGFEDVAVIAKPVMNHRLILNYQARFDRVDSDKVIDELLEELDDAGLELPADVSLQNA